MRKIWITIFYVTTVTLAFSALSCSDKSADVLDKGIWIKLESGQESDGYVRFGEAIYGIYTYDIADCQYYDPLKGIDIPSFAVCQGSGYAKDNKHVYYPLSLICEDGTEFGGCYFVDYIVEDADPKTFKYIGNGYAVDRNNMYYNGKTIPWDDNKIPHH